MRKLLFIPLALASMQTLADDYTYPYLVLTANDGTQTALPVDGLRLTFSDGQLVATTSNGQQTLDLSTLFSMAFSTTTSTETAIERTVDTLQPVEVYTVSGISRGSFDSLGEAKATLPHGIYIIKQQDKTLKISVK